jgi:phosphoribosylformylglycinamidine synthase
MPVEHAEGKVVTADDTVMRDIEARRLIALRYVDDSGRFDTYPANPNGSVGGIAGLCDETGRIFGLMPHPDRHLDPTQHPLWTRRVPNADGRPDGLSVFDNAVEHWTRAVLGRVSG